MIRCGKLCKACSAAHCKETDEQIEVECPACDGMGCDQCQSGFFRLEGCPQKYVAKLVPAIRVADLWNEKNIPPAAGGSLDQSASFIEFAGLLEAEDRRAKNDGQA